MYERILVPLDGSELAEAVLPVAEQMAKGLGARLDLLSIVEEDVVAAIANPMGGRYAAQVEASAQTVAKDYLAKVADRLKLPKDKVKTKVMVAMVPEAIVREAEKGPGTLIVLSTHGRSGVGRWVLGSVADKVLHATKAPLLLYRAREDQSLTRAGGEIRSMVVPVDGSELAEDVLPHVKVLAGALGLKVTLVRISSVLPPYYGGSWFYTYTYPEGMLAEIEKDAEEYLKKKAQELKAQSVKDVFTVQSRGSAAVQIVDLVRSTPGSMAVISTHGRSGVGRWVLGSVADRVVQGAGAPVLVIRS
ncbi:MAG: universal stress protein [Dehalococcoidia bacterium]|nr:universal stress protein [Dehalococcoidia bacterium]